MSPSSVPTSSSSEMAPASEAQSLLYAGAAVQVTPKREVEAMRFDYPCWPIFEVLPNRLGSWDE